MVLIILKFFREVSYNCDVLEILHECGDSRPTNLMEERSKSENINGKTMNGPNILSKPGDLED